MTTKLELPASGNPLNLSSKCEINDLCRLCLCTTNNKLEIFGKVGELSKISEIINILFSIQVLPNDRWPQNICISCFQKLTDYHEFYSTVKSSEVTLVELCGNLTSPESWVDDREEEKLCATESPTDFKNEENSQDGSFPDDYPLAVKLEVLTDAPEPQETAAQIKELSNCSEEPQAPTQKKPRKQLKTKVSRTRKNSRISSKKKGSSDAEVAKFIKLTCEICATIFSTFDGLKVHFQEIHNQEGYVKCCGFTIKTRATLIEHIHYHRDPKKYECKECGRSFKSRARLCEHRYTHVPEDEKQFKCEQCPMKFVTFYRLKYHQMIHVPREQWEHFCPQCNKAFPTVYVMRSHVKLIHERSQKKVCEICAKVFNTNQSFAEHKVTHMDKPPTVECEQCGKVFRDRRNMVRHMRLHKAPIGIFGCDICGKEFPRKQRLQKHKTSAHGKKSFKCNQCEKEFKQALNLREHLATHTGQQSLYKCNFCDKMFNSNANRYVHQKRNHPIEWEEQRRKKLEKN